MSIPNPYFLILFAPHLYFNFSKNSNLYIVFLTKETDVQ